MAVPSYAGTTREAGPVTTATQMFLGLTMLAAIGDWVAAHGEHKMLEYVCKPAVMVFLLGVTLSIEPAQASRWLFVGAVLFSLAGDVFLMLPDRKRWFIFGLASFLLGHLCYIPGLWTRGVTLAPFAVGLLIVVVGAAVVGRTVLAAVQRERPKLLVPVVVYMGVLGLMAASAIGTALPIVVLGGLLFFASDSTLAWNEFVKPFPFARVAIHVTYHLGQIGLVLALL